MRRRMLLALALIMIALVVACGSGDDDSLLDPVEPADPSLTTVTSLQGLVSAHGYPASATFARLRVPRLGIDAQVSTRVVGAGAEIFPDPDGPAEVAWYDLSAWVGLGGTPGIYGNSIFGGHVDYNGRVGYAGVNYRGPGVFKDLRTLTAGDLIEVEYRGETLTYAVVWSNQLDAGSADWEQIWSSHVAVESITLFTCGGAFDSGSRSYSDRVVVRAERI